MRNNLITADIALLIACKTPKMISEIADCTKINMGTVSPKTKKLVQRQLLEEIQAQELNHILRGSHKYKKRMFKTTIKGNRVLDLWKQLITILEYRNAKSESIILSIL